MYNAAPVKFLFLSMTLILFSMNLFHCFLPSFFPGATNQGLSRALTSNSHTLSLYLFSFCWGSHTSEYVEGILISRNVPALT